MQTEFKINLYKMQFNHRFTFFTIFVTAAMAVTAPDFSVEVDFNNASMVRLRISTNPPTEIWNVSQISCSYQTAGTNCLDALVETTITGTIAYASFQNLDAASLIQFSVSNITLASGYEIVANRSVLHCSYPPDVDWYGTGIIYQGNLELDANADGYEISLNSSDPACGQLDLVHYDGWDPVIYDLESGCKYHIKYAARCSPDLISVYHDYPASFCTRPTTPSSNLVFEGSSETQLNISGFEKSVSLDVLTGCIPGALLKTMQVTTAYLVIDNLIPGCSYTLKLSTVCVADSNTEESTNVQTSIRNTLCTVPEGIETDISFNTTSNSITFQGSVTPVTVVEGKVDKFGVKTLTPADGTHNGPVAKDSDLVLSGLSPGTEYHIELESRIDGCSGTVSTKTQTYTACTAPVGVSSLEQTSSDSISFVLTWESVQGSAPDYYAISVSNLTDGIPNIVATLSANTNWFESSDWIGPKPTASRFNCSVFPVYLDLCDLDPDYPLSYSSPAVQSISCGTRAEGGEPTNYHHDFLGPQAVIVNWTAPDDFVDVFDTDHYLVSANDEEPVKEPANSKELSATLTEVPVCENVTVTITPVRYNIQSVSADFVIINWDNDSAASELIEVHREVITLCEICPSEDLNKFCSFPFEFDGSSYNTCTPFSGPGSLNCKDKNGNQLSCYSTDHCLPEVPDLNNLQLELVTARESVKLSWSVSSNAYSHFDIEFQNELRYTTTGTDQTIDGLDVGISYDIALVMDSFGRRSKKKIISFSLTDSGSIAFASNITTSSATFAWSKLKKLNTSESSPSQVTCRVSEEGYVRLFLNDTQVNEVRVFNVSDQSNSLIIEDVNPGMPLRCEILVQGENETLIIIAPIVPNPPTNVSLTPDETSGSLLVVGNLSDQTGAERLHHDTIVIENKMHTIQDDGLTLIISVETNNTNLPKQSCQTVDCVSGSLEFSQTVLDEIPEPGLIVSVDTYSSTGPAEAEHLKLSYAQAPNPIENLLAYSVDETSIKISWQPPLTGYLHHFRVVHLSLNRPEIIQEITGGYLRYIATQLEPGSTHVFRVYAVADEEGLVVSTPTEIAVDTAPEGPTGLKLWLEYPLDEPRRVTASFRPPSSGLYERFKVNIFEIGENGDEVEYADVLQGSEVSPFFLDSATFDFELNFAKFGSVYKVELRSLSKNNRESLFPDEQLIMTGTGIVGVEIDEILKNGENFCFLWEIVQSEINAFDAMECSLSQGETKTSFLTEQMDHEQNHGLACLDSSTLIPELPFTLETSFSKHLLARNFSVSSPPVSVEFQDVEEKTFHLAISSNCEQTLCRFELTDYKLPKRRQFQFEFELSRGVSREFERAGVFLGSDCGDSPDTCEFVLEGLTSSTDYSISISVGLFGNKLPKTFTHAFSTTESNHIGLVAILLIVLGVVVAVAVIAAGFVLMVKKFVGRSNRGISDQAIYANPAFPPAGSNRGTGDQSEYANPAFSLAELRENVRRQYSDDSIYDEKHRYITPGTRFAENPSYDSCSAGSSSRPNRTFWQGGPSSISPRTSGNYYY